MFCNSTYSEYEATLHVSEWLTKFTHACTRGKAISFICRRRHENCQISRSRHLAIRKHNESIKFGKETGLKMFEIV